MFIMELGDILNANKFLLSRLNMVNGSGNWLILKILEHLINVLLDKLESLEKLIWI